VAQAGWEGGLPRWREWEGQGFADCAVANADGSVAKTVTVDDDRGVAITLFAPLKLADGTVAKVEVDTGSDSLILHRRFLPPTGEFKVVRAKDETNHAFERFFGKLEAPTWLGGLPALERKGQRVMFQEIIYDGLIGHDFLRNYTVTFDMPHSRMILGLPAWQRQSAQ